ncbi:SRPBCC domain-containing protein [Corynebacterium breve]|uniref:SRPBCC domain-containing protein n=1 Tax=Corynebacterium breve TaxID=3049799 RepID=A0ABY8VKR6_9CORY|nr:SRPBCC domain-containing protein [Corynebacterium breve]WIM68823.1 SRPBCC domain-containing protein [Corynebacterium breve]
MGKLVGMTREKRGQISANVLSIPTIFDHPRDHVWKFVTTSETLVTFYGSFSGDPASGEVTLIMVEAPDNPGTAVINRCVAPELLDVTLSDGEGNPWSLILKLEALDDDHTRVEFIQDIAGFETMAADVGAGWEFYIDRWVAAMAGEDVEKIAWEDYAPLAQQYEPEVNGSPS